jgi:hypothetical protein
MGGEKGGTAGQRQSDVRGIRLTVRVSLSSFRPPGGPLGHRMGSLELSEIVEVGLKASSLSPS